MKRISHMKLYIEDVGKKGCLSAPKLSCIQGDVCLFVYWRLRARQLLIAPCGKLFYTQAVGSHPLDRGDHADRHKQRYHAKFLRLSLHLTVSLCFFKDPSVPILRYHPSGSETYEHRFEPRPLSRRSCLSITDGLLAESKL